MIITPKRVSLLALIWGLPAAALDLSVPDVARLTHDVTRASARYEMPIGPWEPDFGLPVLRVEGIVAETAFRIDSDGPTPLQLLQPLRDAIRAAEYETVFDCDAARCGGFDFRFGTRVVEAPAMFVNLNNFHFYAARHPGGDIASVLTTQTGQAAYVQIIRAGNSAQTSIKTTDRLPSTRPADGSVVDRLVANGHAVLADVTFASGVANLESGAIASLDAIAAFLAANPDRRVLFVGHTDATGSLDGNRTVSRQRAQAAMAYLRRVHKTPERQVNAQGAGFLAPIASNLTKEGRVANRRVEAVLLSAHTQ